MCNPETCTCPPNEELKRWERFQQAAHNEKGWMNDRLNWMFVPQGLFFAALAWIVQLKYEALEKTSPNLAMIDKLTHLEAMIATLGITMALVGFVGVVAAGTMHFKWTSEVNKIAAAHTDGDNPYTFGSKPHWPARTTSIMPGVVALAFTFAWGLLICTHFDDGVKNTIATIVLLGAFAVFIFVLIVKWVGDKKLPEKARE